MAIAESGPVSTTMSVSMIPGSKAFTVIPSVPTSRAAALTSPLMACLQATYPGMPGLPSLPSTDDVTRTRPDSRGIMCCNARRMAQNTELKFQSTSSFHSSSGICATGAVLRTPPALHTMMSRWPKRSTAKSTMPSLVSCFDASPGKKAARSPTPISSRACLPFCSSRPFTTTLAPSRTNASAMPRPMLRVPLVTAATFPSSLPIGSPLCSVRRRAAVDRDERAGDAATGLGGEQQGHHGHVLDFVEPLDRGLLGVHLEELFVGEAHALGGGRADLAHDVGLDPARAQRVDGDPLCPDLVRAGLG